MNEQPNFHPTLTQLTEYAAGTLPRAQAIAIKAHLHFCHRCQQEVHQLENLGGDLLENTETVDQKTLSLSFNQLMERVQTLPSKNTNEETGEFTDKTTTVISNHTDAPDEKLPKIIRKLAAATPIKWINYGKGFSSANLLTGQRDYGVYLKKLQAGMQAPRHDHRAEEITVVLDGSFSDENGLYCEGDFITKQSGDIHSPRATEQQACLCLTVEAAPVTLTSTLGRLLNPFLRISAN